MRTLSRAGLVFVLALALAPASARAATITVFNLDAAGEGFNDPTPAAPVGGNPGTTVGAQRLFVFQYAANVWGGLLASPVTIRIGAHFDPQSCTATSGVLGSAGPTTVHRDFANAPFSATWYHQALANRLAGVDLSAQDDIAITFNSSVGGPSCLPSGWYYGVDGNEGSKIELLPVVLHEMGHGLGFSTTTDGQTGSKLGGFPGAYDHFLLDKATGKHWNQMTTGEITSSSVSCQGLVWDGAAVTSQASSRLGSKPLLRVNTPAGLVGDYGVGTASFGAALTSGGVTGDVVLANDGVGNPSNACEPLTGSVAGKIVLIDRGTCGFTAKVKTAQNAGAIGVIVADSVAGCPAAGMGGSDPTITIPSVRVTQSDGATLKSQIGSGLNVTLINDPAMSAGADGSGHVYVYAPNPYQPGSSVSHWDTSAEPSLLMEPALTSTLSQDVDLTLQQFIDIGWAPSSTAVNPPPLPRPGVLFGVASGNPSRGGALLQFTLPDDDDVNLSVFDLKGRLVAGLVGGHVPAGDHSVRWEGTDVFGRAVASGVYLVQLRTRTVRETRHLIFVH